MLDQLLSIFGGSGLALWGPFLLLILCGLGLPIPEDIILITAGYLGGDQGYPYLLTAGLMYLGILMGDSVIFAMGKYLGRRALHLKFIRNVITNQRLFKAEALFLKWGTGVIFVGRFLPGLRAPIFFSAGLLRFSIWKFLLMDGFAALISAPVFVWLGHWAWEEYSDDLEQIEEKIGQTQSYLLFGALVMAALIFIVIRARMRLKKRATNEN